MLISPAIAAMLGESGATAPTASLDEFVEAYNDDDAIWWRMKCGHHQNLFDMAIERMLAAENLIQVLRTGGYLTDKAKAAMDEAAELMP